MSGETTDRSKPCVGIFWVYRTEVLSVAAVMDACPDGNRFVDSPQTRAVVTDAFGLDRQRALFAQDTHYTTDSDDLERLFED